jgi:hypothetical protein
MIIEQTKQSKNKMISVAIAVLLLLSITSAFNPLANAQTSGIVRTFNTQSFMRISPNPAGIGQSVTIYVFCSFEPSQINNRPYFGWNYTVTVTDPTGVSKTYNMPMTLSTGYTYLSFTPTQNGTYHIQAHLPSFYLYYDVAGSGGFTPGNYSYIGSDTTVQDLNVQLDQVIPWPQTPLPTNYWQFPITAENQLWGSIAGNWLYRSTQNPPTPDQTWGPRTAHILWTTPITIGGISGGSYQGETEGGFNYWTGLLYQKIVSPVIISGYLYYNMNPSGQGKPGVNCVSLRTGEVVWSNSSFPLISCGQVFTREGGLGSGSLAYLWCINGSTWQMYDAWNGHFITQFENATGSFAPYFGPSGEIIVYNVNAASHWITKWNSSIAILGVSARANEGWSPFSTQRRAWSDGIQWNVTIPTLANAPTWRMTDMEDDVIVCEGNFGTNTTNPIFDIVGYSASTGAQLWVKNYTNIGWGEGGPVNAGLMVFNWAFGQGVFAFYERETMKWHIIDIKTGVERCTTPPLNEVTNNDWSFYDWHPAIRYGKLYTTGYSGSVCCFNLQTGKTEWVFNQINSGVMTPYGDWPTYGGMTIADGIVYFGVSQHTPATPMYKGYNLYAINASDGKQIWSLPCFADPTAVAAACSELFTFNGYDNQIYLIGKGRSATAVTAPQTEMQLGSKVLITGTVTDQSPGQTAIGVPAAGTPAISDNDMTQWMKYLYQQQPKPTNARGVLVHITAIDPNGNLQEIGNATSDMTGNYVISWTPPVSGIYTITASFAGTDSYYSSSAEAYFIIGQASNASPQPTLTGAPTATPPAPTATVSPTPIVTIAPAPTENSSTATYIAITAVALIIVIAAIAVILRRRK